MSLQPCLHNIPQQSLLPLLISLGTAASWSPTRLSKQSTREWGSEKDQLATNTEPAFLADLWDTQLCSALPGFSSNV